MSTGLKKTGSHKFIGRKYELSKILSIYERKSPSLIVIKGRRRIGKSRLISEFALRSGHGRFFNFSALAPQSGLTSQTQRDHFARQFAEQLRVSPMVLSDWSDTLNRLSKYLANGDILLFDEISWMAHKDPTFIPKLKAWWDSQEVRVLLVLCGSISTWVEENIINSTAFFGRIALTLTLEPLAIPECAQFLKMLHFRGSEFDQFKLISILGGVPWYLEQINSKMMADENIKQLCFQKDGLLVMEFDRIFNDLFNGKGSVYKKILKSINASRKTLAEIRRDIDYPKSGTLSQLVGHLITAGFVKEHYQWLIKSQALQKQSLYRISDSYIRFYLKTIERLRPKIELNAFDNMAIGDIPGFDSNMGLQVENLLLQNRLLLLKALDIHPSECSFDGPYRQSKTARTLGCQIDYLIQTRTNNLFLCEIKFKRKELGLEVVDEVREKMKRLSLPRGFALVPVLFHFGGVSESVVNLDYFYRIIDISSFLDL